MLLIKIVKLESVISRRNVRSKWLWRKKQKNFKDWQNKKKKSKLCFKQEKISQMKMVLKVVDQSKMEEGEVVQIVKAKMELVDQMMKILMKVAM